MARKIKKDRRTFRITMFRVTYTTPTGIECTQTLAARDIDDVKDLFSDSPKHPITRIRSVGSALLIRSTVID
jgi:hypothetical protein